MSRGLAVLSSFWVWWCGSAFAAPTAVPYVGYLTYAAGGLVDQDVDVTVAIYDAATEGTALWGPHDYSDTPVSEGVFSILLGGGGTPDVAPALDSGAALWLGFSINGAPMVPRQAIHSVPFARRADNAAQLGGEPAANYTLTADLPNAALSGSFSDLDDVPTDLATATGTAGTLAIFDGAHSLGNSALRQVGSDIAIGTVTPRASLDVAGSIRIGNDTSACTVDNEGALRWTGTALELCASGAWGAVSVAGAGAESGLFPFTSHTFTNCGQTGHTGPSLTQCQSVYTSTESAGWRNDPLLYAVSGGIQQWTVPEEGIYRLEATGAHGGCDSGGAPAYLRGEFSLTAGTVLHILVGHRGSCSSGNARSGGGGGSFIVADGTSPLLVAGGGGGGGGNGQGGTATTDVDALDPVNISCGAPGAGDNGGGGGGGANYGSGGGGGYFTNGGHFGFNQYNQSGGGGGNQSVPGGNGGGVVCNNSGGRSFLNGGQGGNGGTCGPSPEVGGFGGGGHGSGGNGNGGGGGGWSGGAGGHHKQNGTPCTGNNNDSTGGGSFNGGTNKFGEVASTYAHGTVSVTRVQ